MSIFLVKLGKEEIILNEINNVFSNNISSCIWWKGICHEEEKKG